MSREETPALDGQALQNTLNQTLDAVREAGAVIREHWEQPRQVQHKGRIDLVTQTDLAVEKKITALLKDVCPKAEMLAEESAKGLTPAELSWIVDPLDGTTNFVHSLPFVAVSAGLWRHDEIILGVVYNPILDEMFWAAKGGGAFRNGTPIRVSDAEKLEQCVATTGFPYNIQDEIGPVVQGVERMLLHCQALRRYGAAALDLAYVACGSYGVFYEAGLKPWDTAAGWRIVEEAGGKVTQLTGLAPYKPGARTMLATNGRLHDEMGRLLGDLYPE